MSYYIHFFIFKIKSSNYDEGKNTKNGRSKYVYFRRHFIIYMKFSLHFLNQLNIRKFLKNHK